MASPLNIELIFLILQFLGEEKFKETRRKFERESGLYFDIKYFEDVIVNGDLEEAETYLKGFTKPDENHFSMKIFFEIRKQKYFEALDKGERAKALDILANELKEFSSHSESVYKDLAMLLSMENIREHKHLTNKYTDAKSIRVLVFAEVKRLLELDPMFSQKLQFPDIPNSRLRTLVNQSLYWQQHHCKNQRTTLPVASSSSATRPFTAAFDDNTADSENAPKRLRQICPAKEPKINVPTFMSIGQSSMASYYSADNLPKNDVKSLDVRSSVTSMDFHPHEETWLLVGTNTGEISTWDVGTGGKLESRAFTIRNPDACSTNLQATLAINRIRWSPGGSVFGAAYSKHMVQLFTHEGAANFNNYLEMDAHVGSVNDLAFWRLPENQLSIVTCGEDNTIKVWDAFNGSILFTFEGHEAPVYSVCPHSQNNPPYILSTATDGSFKVWFFEPAGKFDFDKTDRSHNVLAYNEDGRRLFSCGRREDGESFIVELDDIQGSVVREYLGLGKKPAEIIQFDNIKNRFLVAGDECAIKYWDMDNANLLMALNISGLPASPCVRFSKEGKLLAVSASNDKIKILSNDDGLCLFNSIDAPTPTSDVPSSSPSRLRLKEISEQSMLRVLRVVDSASPVRIVKLMYYSAGNAIIALAHNGIHKIWKWQSTPKATTEVQPALWHHRSGRVMANNTDQDNLDEAVLCFALSKNDSFVLSASGARLSLFNAVALKVLASVFPPPPAATAVAFLPRDNNIAAVGMDDCSIQIYHMQTNAVVQHKLEGHTNKVTGLAFSTLHNILVSSGSDNKLCVWNVDGWERKRTAFLQFPPGRVPTCRSPTKVEFDHDQTNVMVVHPNQIAIYTAPGLDCDKHWFPAEAGLSITDATYSCDGQTVYIALETGGIRVLAASSLILKCRINPPAYMNPSLSSSDILPTSIASNPKEPNQFALGLTDGGICVLEPKYAGGDWGEEPPDENVASRTMPPLQLR